MQSGRRNQSYGNTARVKDAVWGEAERRREMEEGYFGCKVQPEEEQHHV